MVEYTIDDIRGPTVAREMAQLKTFVLEKFNGAIADAEAAAAAAATAAANAVLDSLDSRVGALEGDMTTAQGDIVTNANAILALDGAVVKLAGAQTISGIKQVPLEATGTASNQIASSQKVKNELDNYTPMVRTTGNQTIAGTKKFTYNLEEVAPINGGDSPAGYTSNYGRFRVTGQDNLPIIGMGFEKATNDVTRLVLNINGNKDSGTGNQTVAQIHFVFDSVNGSLTMVPAHIDKNNARTFGTPIPLMTWTP